MKKMLLHTGMGFTALFILSAPVASALTAESVIPVSTNAVYTFDTTVQNPLENFLINSLENSTDADLIAISSKFKDTINNTVISAILEFPETSEPYQEDPSVCFLLEVDSNTFNSIITEVTKQTTLTTESYNGKTINFNSETFISDLGGQTAICSTEAQLKKVIDTVASSNPAVKITSTPGYNDVNSKINVNAFFRLFIRPNLISSYSSEITDLSQLNLLGLNISGIIDALNAEAISIEQTTNGFTMKIAVQGDKTKLTTLGLPMNKNNFTPTLYKTISGNNLIAYSESVLDQDWFNNLLKFTIGTSDSADLTDMKTTFKENTAIDFDTDIIEVFHGPQMFTLHQDTSFWPAATYILKVLPTNQDKAAATLEKFNSFLGTTIKFADSAGIITPSTETISDGTFYTYKFDIRKTLFSESFLNRATSDAIAVTLRFGITSDGRVIISTLKNLSAALNTSNGLSDNGKFNKVFPVLNESIADIGYLDLDQFNKYATSALGYVAAENALITATQTLLNPWHTIYGKSYSTENTTWMELKLDADTSAFANHTQTMSSWYTSLLESELTPFTGYCDVSKEDWFYPYVKLLTKIEVVNGYYTADDNSLSDFLDNNKCFKPGKGVTRAEFIKMTIKAAEQAGYNLPPFSDANETIKANPLNNVTSYLDYDDSSNQWYNSYLDQAVTNGIIHGYPDRKLYPSQTVTRAEAVAILYNLSNVLKGVNVIAQPLTGVAGFNDVLASDWFLTPVASAKYYGLVNGVTATTFEPGRAITRAEAAKIIANFYNLETK